MDLTQFCFDFGWIGFYFDSTLLDFGWIRLDFCLIKALRALAALWGGPRTLYNFRVTLWSFQELAGNFLGRHLSLPKDFLGPPEDLLGPPRKS